MMHQIGWTMTWQFWVHDVVSPCHKRWCHCAVQNKLNSWYQQICIYLKIYIHIYTHVCRQTKDWLDDTPVYSIYIYIYIYTCRHLHIISYSMCAMTLVRRKKSLVACPQRGDTPRCWSHPVHPGNQKYKYQFKSERQLIKSSESALPNGTATRRTKWTLGTPGKYTHVDKSCCKWSCEIQAGRNNGPTLRKFYCMKYARNKKTGVASTSGSMISIDILELR